MKVAVKPYSVIAQDNWTVDSLVRATSSRRFGWVLGEVTQFNRHRLDVDSLLDGESYPYIEVASVAADTGMITSPKMVIKSELPIRAKLIGHTGDVLLSTVRPERGLVAIIPEELDGCIVTNAFVVLSPIQVSSEVLYFALRSSVCREDLLGLARGSAVPTVSLKELSKYVLPFHSVSDELRDQARDLYLSWAGISASSRSLGEVVEEVIAQTLLLRDSEPQRKAPKHAIISYASLEDRLDAPYYLAGQTVSAEWNVPMARLADVIDTTRAGVSVPPSKYSDDGTPFIRIQDLDNESIYLDPSTAVKVPEGNYRRSELAVGDLLISRVGSVGKVNVVSEAAAGTVASQHVLVNRVRDDLVTPEYLALFLKTKWGRSQFEAMAVGVAQQFIQQSALANIVVPLPDIERQMSIVAEVNAHREHVGLQDLDQRVQVFYTALFKLRFDVQSG